MTVRQDDHPQAEDGGTGLFTTAQVTDPTLAGASASQHVVLSASAMAARLLGTSQAQLVGADLRQVLCDMGNRRSVDGWQALERQLEAQQEGAAQLPVPDGSHSRPSGGANAGSSASHGGGAAPRWLDVSVTALPGGRYAWSCDACAAPGAAPASARAVQSPPPWQPPRRLSSVETAALRALPQPVWVCDARGRCLFANPAFCRLARCGEGGATGRPWTQLLPRPAHPADAAAVQQLEAAIATGQPAQAEVQCRGSASASTDAHGCESNAGEGEAASSRGESGASSPHASRWWGTVSVSPLDEKCSDDDALACGAPLLVCTLLGGPAAAPAAAAATAAASPAPAPAQAAAPAGGSASGGGAAAAAAVPSVVPPALAQLCNQALASTSEGVWILDPTQQGNPIVWANAAFERMTGYTQASVLGRGHSLLQGPDTDPVVLADIAAAMDEGRPVVAELLVYRRDGSAFWCQVSITPIRDATTGCVANFVAVQRDISQRKAVEAASHVREQALSNLNEGICICDASQKDCPVVDCNNAFLRITGYSRKEVLGRNCRFLQGPRTATATVQRLATALHEGREITVELLNYRKNGEEFYNMLSITPVRDSSGRLLSFIGVQSDITELVLRRQAEKELQEAKVAAETAVEAKSMFLANMSHEIRTPLNGMIAVAQLLLSSGLNPEQRELTDTILESGNTLLTILGDILDFSKIDHNSMVLESAPLALRDTLEASIEMVAADAGRKGLDVAYSLAQPLDGRCLMGDSIRIRQILSNLLSNAVKFTAGGEVVVDCWVEEEACRPAAGPSQPLADAAGASTAAGNPGRPQQLHITVRDTGIGISEESMKRLFQQFRQGHESMSRRYGGTGLGLAISRRLAQLMGGDVWAESVDGQGSTFHFTMDLHWEGDAPPRTAAAAAAAAAGATGPGAAAAGAAGSSAAVQSSPRFASVHARRAGSSSFESSLGMGGDSLSASRQGSESGEPARPQRRPSSSSWCGVDVSSSSAEGGASSGATTAAAATAGCKGGNGGGSCGGSSGGAGHGAEEQRLLLQQHHEALLQKLAQRTVGQQAEGSVASSEAGVPLGGMRLSGLTDAPDTPCVPRGVPAPRSTYSTGSSSSMLASLAGSSRSLAGLAQLAQQAQQAQRRPRSADAQRSSSAVHRASAETTAAAAAAAAAHVSQGVPVAAAAAAHHQRGSGDSVRSCPERVSMDVVRPLQSLPPPVDYRMSSFYSPSPPIQPAKPPPKPVRPLHSRQSSGSKPTPELEAPAPAAASAAAAEEHAALPASPSAAAPAAAAVLPSVHAAPGLEGAMGRSSGDCCAASSVSAPAAPTGTSQAASGPAAASRQAGAAGWNGIGAGSEAAVLRGRLVCIDIAHGPTAVQVAQSCRLLGMRVASDRRQQAAGAAVGDFCITTADKALEAVRNGWRGRPLVVLGRREDVPSNLQPLTTTVSKPVKHCRLVGALLKANAFSRSKQQAPLHLDPHMLSLLPERMLLNPLAGANRRISLDNSALDRRRWEMAAAAAAAAAADGDSTLAPAARGSAAPSPRGSHPPPVFSPTGSFASNGPDTAVPNNLPSLQDLQLGPAAGRRSSDSTCSGSGGGGGGWQPELSVIHSDGSREGSQRSSVDRDSGGQPGASGAWGQQQFSLAPLQTVQEHESCPTSPAAAAAGMPASTPAAAAAVPVNITASSCGGGGLADNTGSSSSSSAPAVSRPPRILVAEDNLINQRVIRKVLERVVPAATVEIVGNGVEALRAVHRGSFDVVLMDIHMPEMDGLEASRRLQAELPEARRPLVVALSADTLQELHQQCRDAGICEFICKPFRIEDVERVLALVQPRLRCSCSDAPEAAAHV